jgi:M6 family metalloprotease-like protein
MIERLFFSDLSKEGKALMFVLWCSLFAFLFPLSAYASSVRLKSYRMSDGTVHTFKTRSAGARRVLPRTRNDWDSERIYKAPVILMSYSDRDFLPEHDLQFYKDMLGKKGFNPGCGQGCVADYFRDQSLGKFNLEFDVVSVKTTYGCKITTNSAIREAIIKAAEYFDYSDSDYDWDGNGEVDQVMIIYAGRGENSGGGSNTIWPHEWNLTEAEGSTITLDGVVIDTYACSCEMQSNTHIDGIGTTCHEFSHCLGLPDFYDVEYGGNYGMGRWSLMAGGSYNDNAFTPAGYTSYERMYSGWLTPVELKGDEEVSQMKSLTEGGEAYIIYNDAYPDEYYLIENRQPVSWDYYLPGSGLLVLHVDYDETVWYWNLVNTIGNYEDDPEYGPGAVNDHQRCTIFHADNYSHSSTSAPYPNYNNNSLTPQSEPAASLYHPNSNGEMFMTVGITDITQNADGTIAFNAAGTTTGINGNRNENGGMNGSWYTLDGRPVNNPAHGIYIYKGKKVKL